MIEALFYILKALFTKIRTFRGYKLLVFDLFHVHSPQDCLVWVACLWSKMPMFQRAGMREEGLSVPLAFQYLILVIWRACDLNLAIISSLASKWPRPNILGGSVCTKNNSFDFVLASASVNYWGVSGNRQNTQVFH